MLYNVDDIIIKNNLLPFRLFHKPRGSFLNIADEQLDNVALFNKEVRNGNIIFESVHCLCGANKFDLIASVDRYSFLQKTVLCKNCGLIQSNPRMTQEQYEKFYSSDFYRRSYEGNDFLSAAQDRYRLETGLHIFEELSKFDNRFSGLSVLEIGAAGGWNLIPFRNSGAEVLGIDFSQNLVELGKKNGLNMIKGSLESIKGQYDIIILNHALEHFLNPVLSLKQIIQHLKDNGLIYIAVPNIANFGMEQIQNAHVYYFDPLTFKYFCELSGLKMLRAGAAQKIHMFGIFKKRSGTFENNILSGHYIKVYVYFRRLRLKNFIKRLLLRNKDFQAYFWTIRK